MYARYARSVVAAESGTWALRRDAVIFNSVPKGDRASAFVHASWSQPLYEEMRRNGDEYGGWETAPVFKEIATRDKLLRLLGGSHRPTLLIAVGHGLEFREGKQQFDDQGALLCSDFTLRGAAHGIDVRRRARHRRRGNAARHDRVHGGAVRRRHTEGTRHRGTASGARSRRAPSSPDWRNGCSRTRTAGHWRSSAMWTCSGRPSSNSSSRARASAAGDQKVRRPGSTRSAACCADTPPARRRNPSIPGTCRPHRSWWSRS